MSQDWLKIRIDLNRQIRAVLVRYFIDIGRLNITITPKRTSIRGTMNTLKGAKMQLNPPLIEEILTAIGRIKGVKGVHADLDNWYRPDIGGPWLEGSADQVQRGGERPVNVETITKSDLVG